MTCNLKELSSAGRSIGKTIEKALESRLDCSTDFFCRYLKRLNQHDDSDVEFLTMLFEGKIKSVIDILSRYSSDLENFKGYYKIKREFDNCDVDRCETMIIFSFLKANGQFLGIIDRIEKDAELGSIGMSPMEFRNFNFIRN
jgi:hypothetical protein